MPSSKRLSRFYLFPGILLTFHSWPLSVFFFTLLQVWNAFQKIKKILCQLFLVASMRRLFWISSPSYCRKWKSICLCLNVESWSEGFLPRSSSPLILHILFSPRWFHSFLLLSAPYQLFPELYLFITFLWLLKQLYHKFGIKQHVYFLTILESRNLK